MKQKIIKTTFITFFLVMIASCAFKPYRFEIQQGNIIPHDKVAQIQPGMTQDQVRFILGTPMLQDVFHTHRWDYIYYRNPQQRGEVEQRHLIVFFENGVVDHIADDRMPYDQA